MKKIILFACLIVSFSSLIACGDDSSAGSEEEQFLSSSENENSDDGEFDDVDSSDDSLDEDMSSSSSIKALEPCNVNGKDNCNYSYLLDSRNSSVYKTVKIGDQVWMAENLDLRIEDSECARKDCSKYGTLYTWVQAVNMPEEECGFEHYCDLSSAKNQNGEVQGICPDGWHLPSKKEFETLAESVGGLDIAGANLKANEGEYGGLNPYGFSLLESQQESGWAHRATQTTLWSSTELNNYEAFALFVRFSWVNTETEANAYSGDGTINFDGAELNSYYKSTLANSVRCVQNKKDIQPVQSSSSNAFRSDIEYGLIEDDRDGQTYKTIPIGSRVWMAENLRWDNGVRNGSYCYNKDPLNCEQYGRLYGWYDAETACPSGWILPSKEDVEELLNIVGTSSDMVEISNGLRDEKWGGSNEYGFSATPSGFANARNIFSEDRYFWGLNETSGFWTSTYEDGALYLHIDMDGAYLSYGPERSYYYSVRCVRAEPYENPYMASSSSGYGVMLDSRDGQSYRTMNYGEQEWMAQNLAYYDTLGHSKCYNGVVNCDDYGRVYSWESAQRVCPDGWHLPSREEYGELFAMEDEVCYDGQKVCDDVRQNLFNEHGFYETYWTSSHVGGQFVIILNHGDEKTYLTTSDNRDNYMFVRCVKSL